MDDPNIYSRLGALESDVRTLKESLSNINSRLTDHRHIETENKVSGLEGHHHELTNKLTKLIGKIKKNLYDINRILNEYAYNKITPQMILDIKRKVDGMTDVVTEADTFLKKHKEAQLEQKAVIKFFVNAWEKINMTRAFIAGLLAFIAGLLAYMKLYL